MNAHTNTNEACRLINDKCRQNLITMNRLVANTPIYQAIGGVQALVDLVRACADEAVAAPTDERFNSALDLAARYAESMEGALIALRSELRRAGPTNKPQTALDLLVGVKR